MRLLVLLTAFIALAACAYSPAPQQFTHSARLVLEIDADQLRAHKLRDLSTRARDELRRQPMIPIDPLGGRKVEGDHLTIRLTPSDIPAATTRLGAMADPPGSLQLAQLPDAVEIRFAEDSFGAMLADALASSVAAVERRVENATGRNPTVRLLDTNRIEVLAPGAQDPAELADLLTQSGVFTFNLVDEAADPDAYEPGIEANGRIALPDDSMDGMLQVVFVDSIIHSSDLSGAAQARDDSNNPSIAFQLHADGAQKLGRATSENVGRFFAIVLDNRIVTAPRIISPIMGGSGQITGQFTREEAERLAVILRSGALPARLKVIEIGIVTNQ